MRTILFISAVLSVIAFANVKPYGTFEAHQCSDFTILPQLCLGTRVGIADEAFEIRLKPSHRATFQVSKKEMMSDMYRPELTIRRLWGQNIQDNSTTFIIVEYRSLSGTLRPVGASFKLRNGKLISVKNFTPVANSL